MEAFRPVELQQKGEKVPLILGQFVHQITLLSSSQIKKNALNQVLSEWRTVDGQPYQYLVTCHNYAQGDDPDQVEQPLDWKGGFGAARNRFQRAIERDSGLLDRADLVVVIENYMESESGNDFACLILHDCHSSTTYVDCYFCAQGEDQELLGRVVDAKNHRWGSPITYGKLLNQRDSSIPANDWMSVVTGKTRQKALEEGLRQLSRAYLDDQQRKVNLDRAMRTYHDFPKFGVVFKDWRPIFQNPDLTKQLIECAAVNYDTETPTMMANGEVLPKIDYVIGLESRGIWLATLLAQRLGVGMIPIRKPGKTPGPICSVAYGKEYGRDTMEIGADLIKNDRSEKPNVVVVDDVLATGGSLLAGIELAEKAGFQVVGALTLIDVPELRSMAAEKLKGYWVQVLIQHGLRQKLIDSIARLSDQ